MQDKRKIGLYIHIPFCVRKCLYCDFLSMPSNETNRYMYVNAMISEIEHTFDKYCIDPSLVTVSSIYVGGGTPSILEDILIRRIFETIHSVFTDISEDAEITIEVNPGTVNRDKFNLYRQLGINRLSIGLQSANNDELKLLGRIHTYEDYTECFRLAQKAGFYNISTDIMTALPGQTEEKLKNTLSKVVQMAPEHISAYSLIIEEGTPFYSYYADGVSHARYGMPALVSEDEERKLYYFARDYLTNNGYKQYEISNYAKDGCESRHNMSYWRRQEYIGYGLGAAGLINDIRFKNTSDMDSYIRNPYSTNNLEEERLLDVNDRMEEFMFLGLRTMKGVSVYEFEKTFGKDIHQVYGKVIDRLSAEGLLIEKYGSLYLSEKGVDYGNYVFSEFLF